MLKTREPAGRFLSDIYATIQAKMGLSRLDDSQVVFTHDMGQEISSERFKWQLVQLSATGVSQSSTILQTGTIPHDRSRLSHVIVFTDTGDGSSIDNIQASVLASVADGVSGMSSVVMPVFVWDSGAGLILPVTGKYEVSGSTSAAYDFLVPQYDHRDLEIIGPKTSTFPAYESVSQVQIRGATNAFGAGTIDVFATFCFQHNSEINQASRKIRSRGLPPSW